MRGVASEKRHDHKKYWNAAARHLSDSCRNHYALSLCYRSCRDGSFGAHRGHFYFDRQIVGCAQSLSVAIALRAVSEQWRRRKLDQRRAPWLQVCDRCLVHNAPTAPEISNTTMLSEIKIWIIPRTFAHRASSGASVGPKVELCVNATNR